MQTEKQDDLSFNSYSEFEERFYYPIQFYVNWKQQNDWDDYNELTHSLSFIRQIIREKSWYKIHTIEKENEIKGVMTLVSAENADSELFEHFDMEETILLKYFHILEKGAGLGSHWLKSVIMPHYYEKGYKNIIVSSSHPKSFNFYRKMGEELKTFTKPSDNKKFQRTCKTFLIPLGNG